MLKCALQAAQERGTTGPPLVKSADDAVYVYADMQRVVEQAQAAATPPDPAVHATSVQQLQTECRESSVRVTSLENEARYAHPIFQVSRKDIKECTTSS